MEIFKEADISITSTQSRKYLARGWHHNNINMQLEIFSMRMASTTSTRRWKYSTRGWHQQHLHEDGNL
jgi:hypothetical protein